MQNLLQDRFIDGILSEEFRYALEHKLSLKERQVCEHLVEGYPDQEIYHLMKKVFPTFNAYKQTKKRVKKKLMQFLGV